MKDIYISYNSFSLLVKVTEKLFKTGRPRGPVLSELEVQLDRLRSYRDTLYAGELAWREAARLTQAAATLAAAGRDSWYSLNNTM